MNFWLLSYHFVVILQSFHSYFIFNWQWIAEHLRVMCGYNLVILRSFDSHLIVIVR